MSTFLSNNIPKNIKFICENCQYKTDNKKDYIKHTNTLKHLKMSNFNIISTKKSQKSHACICGKNYKERTGLWKHKKTCNFENKKKEKEEKEEKEEKDGGDEMDDDNDNNSENEYENENKKKEKQLEMITNLFQEQLKENKELKDLILEQNKKFLELLEAGKIGNMNITNNSNNKTKFNLNFFLNEQCKDALNLMDFVNDLQIKITDLENVGRLGYCEGISKIFINGLQQLDVSKRPIHCSDSKREVLYIKDQNTWEKENEENKKIKKAIYHISHKNIQQIQKWTENHPHYKESDSKQNDQYLQILCESMGSAEPANLEKVIRNIAKEVVIEK
jgi:hypothetical protein